MGLFLSTPRAEPAWGARGSPARSMRLPEQRERPASARLRGARGRRDDQIVVAAGVPPWFMVAHSAGERFNGLVDAEGRPAEEADRSGGAVFRLERALPPIGPGSWRLALKSLRSPGRRTWEHSSRAAFHAA